MKLRFPLRPFDKLPHYDFMRWRVFWIQSSVASVAAALVLIFAVGLNFGIDFAGGKLVQVRIASAPSVSAVRTAIEKGGFGEATIQEYGAADEFLIRLSAADPQLQGAGAEQRIQAALTQTFGAQAGAVELRRVEFVGPQVGQELRVKGALAMLAAIVGILIYVWFRFELRYGLGAILALVHDTILTVGVMVILQTEVTLTVLAAILTLIGYSLNDTIVIFDRIRENRLRMPNLPLTEVLNLSVNQTVARTIMTVSTTLLVLLALFFLGGDVIHDFSLVLVVGIVLGTYSSVFVASPVLLALEEWYQRMAKEKANEQQA